MNDNTDHAVDCPPVTDQQGDTTRRGDAPRIRFGTGTRAGSSSPVNRNFLSTAAPASTTEDQRVVDELRDRATAYAEHEERRADEARLRPSLDLEAGLADVVNRAGLREQDRRGPNPAEEEN